MLPRRDLIAYLARHTEDVSIILHEPPYSCKATEGSGSFISMNDTKLGHADRELLIAAVAVVEDETMSRTVHGLESEFLFIDVQDEHIVLVMLLERTEIVMAANRGG